MALRRLSGEWIASSTKSEQDTQYLYSYEFNHAWELMYNTQINKYMDEVISEGKDTCYTNKTQSCDEEQLEDRMRWKREKEEKPG